ncbi:uncharacterized protein LOC143293456 [Babylonia areolata]|uniref:uncharacterized protein LOC143293456 n=1 Tax=Babylonia areolata TaxID=304850 RepID=UPI003FD49DAC
MMGKVFLAVTCLAGVTSAFLFSNVEWNGLSVTFGLNPFNSWVLDDLPRTMAAARYEGWTQISHCDASGTFRGNRYIKDNDYAVILLFDVNGYIAGIQCGIAKTDGDFPPVKQRGHIFQEEGNHYFLTAYFTDPAAICSEGRTPEEYSVEGTGTGLYIQNGSDPITQSVLMPYLQDSVQGTNWTMGYCFPVMGKHYWYNITEDMSCDDFQPVFLLYNRGKLNAFGWALGIHQASQRFEHPTQDKFGAFMNPVPRCLRNHASLSTMHIYMTARPSLNFC